MNILHSSSSFLSLFVAGNHDIGYDILPKRASRFRKTFNTPLNYIVRIPDKQMELIVLNSMALESSSQDTQEYEDAYNLLKTSKNRSNFYNFFIIQKLSVHKTLVVIPDCFLLMFHCGDHRRTATWWKCVVQRE